MALITTEMELTQCTVCTEKQKNLEFRKWNTAEFDESSLFGIPIDFAEFSTNSDESWKVRK